MNQNAGATATPSSRSVETDNVYVRAQYPDGSNRPITTASTSNNGVLGNTNRRYYFNSSVNQNALSRSSALNRAKRSVHHHPDARITTLPLDDSTPTLTLTSSSNFGHSGKSKRVSPLPRLFRLVSKSSDYLERKLQSLNRTGSTSELLGAANLRPDQNKPIRSVRKKSLETTEQLTIITTTGTGSELVWTHVDGISFENNRLISNRLCHDQDVTASIEPSSNESTSEASPMHQPLDSYLIQDRSNSILSNHNQHTVHIRSSTGADHWQRWWRLIRNVMRQQGRQIAIAALLLLSIWNAFGNNDEPLKTRSAAQPRKFFFDPDSRVIDFELGNLAHLSQAASKREATLVMYYAPWDAECQRFRRDYETIASHYREQVMLAAINCWWPEGECGKSFKIKRYPILLAYLRSVGEVEYRGPLVTSYLMTFIDNLLNPLERLIGAGDLLHLRAKHDAVVLGFFDFDHSPNPPGYEHFLQASIKALHTDPWRRVQFAIVSSKSSSAKFEFERTGQVQIHTWNDTVIYGGNLHQVDTFVRWIFEIVFELQRPLIEWVTASGKKSDALISRLSSGPTLLLFTPRSLVFGISPYFEVLREVAMDYFNCDDSPQIKSLIHRSILRRRSKEERLIDLERKCYEMTQPNAAESEVKAEFLPKDFVRDDRCCYSQLIDLKLTESDRSTACYCTACVHINTAICPANCKRFNCLATAARYMDTFEISSPYLNASATKCNQIRSSYLPKFTPYFDIRTRCFDLSEEASRRLTRGEASAGPNLQFDHDHSDAGMRRMLKNVEEEHCRRLRYGLGYSDFNFPETGEGNQAQKWRENFTGLGCRVDRPLQILAIDSILFPAFTENFGIDVFNETHATVAMIVEPDNETVYVLNERLRSNRQQPQSIGKQHLYRFIRDYSDRKLNRYVRSKSPDRVSSRQNCENQLGPDGVTQVLCVPEITAHSFSHFVLDSSKDVVLMHYTPWCGFCSSVAHTYLTVARFFASIPQVLFTRINGDANQLPFEYAVDRYPAIAFYPANRKADHVLYPANMPITTTGLIQFVLANSADLVKWQAALKFCDRDCLQRNLLDYSTKQTRLERQLSLLRDHLPNCPQSFLSSLRDQISKGRQALYAVSTFKSLILDKLGHDRVEPALQTLHDQLQEDMMHIVNHNEQLTTSKHSDDHIEGSINVLYKANKLSAKKLKLPSRVKSSKKDEL